MEYDENTVTKNTRHVRTMQVTGQRQVKTFEARLLKFKRS